MKSQNIKFTNQLDYNAINGGIVKPDTEVLNLYFLLNDLPDAIIGSQYEWIPLIWMNFEKQKNKPNLEEINIVCLKGNMYSLKKAVQSIFPKAVVNCFSAPLYHQIYYFRDTLSRSKLSTPVAKNKILHYTIGFLRSNRYLALKFCLQNNIEIYYPEIDEQTIQKYEDILSKMCNIKTEPIKPLLENRLFGDCLQDEFNAKQVSILDKSLISFVCTSPTTNLWIDREDEKFFDCVLTKTVPFMLCEKNANVSGVELLGFKPYKHFNLQKDSIDNRFDRWNGLLEDNKDFFVDIEQARNVYEENLDVIEYNYKLLTTTNWEETMQKQIASLPEFVRNFLHNYENNVVS